MSAFLQRFRERDTRKYLRAFGEEGTLITPTGRYMPLVGIGRDPYQASVVVDVALENTSPAVWFVSTDLPDEPLTECIWRQDGQPDRNITSQEPNSRTGLTRCTLTET
jgi:hypothetical protein